MLTLLLLLVLITPPGLVDDGPRRLRHSPPSGTGNCELPAEILQPRAGKEDYLTSVLLSGCSASLAGLSGFCFFYSSRLFFSTLYFCLASISISLHQCCRVPAILVTHLSPGLLDQFWDQSKLQSSKSGLFGSSVIYKCYLEVCRNIDCLFSLCRSTKRAQSGPGTGSLLYEWNHICRY